jgi:hypothetical protein
MVFTAGQTTAFFEHAEQMGIPHATVIQLVVEGIDEVQDLEMSLHKLLTTSVVPEVEFPIQILLHPQEPLLLNHYSVLAPKLRSDSSQHVTW